MCSAMASCNSKTLLHCSSHLSVQTATPSFCAQQGHNPVRAERPPGDQADVSRREPVCRQVSRRRFDEAGGLIVRSEQRLDFYAQAFIASTGLLKEGSALLRLALDGGVEEA